MAPISSIRPLGKSIREEGRTRTIARACRWPRACARAAATQGSPEFVDDFVRQPYGVPCQLLDPQIRTPQKLIKLRNLPASGDEPEPAGGPSMQTADFLASHRIRLSPGYRFSSRILAALSRQIHSPKVRHAGSRRPRSADQDCRDHWT